MQITRVSPQRLRAAALAPAFDQPVNIVPPSYTRAKELMFHAVNIARRVRNPLISFSGPLFWEQGAAGSNPAAPTNKIKALADLCVPQECRCGTVANLIG